MDEARPAGLPSWYVVMTKPGGEERVSSQLTTRLGMEVYVPRIEVKIRRGRGLVMAVRPLFPGYLFARMKIPDQWRLVSFTRGVIRILGSGRDPQSVSETVIETIRAREREPDRLIPYYNFQADDRIVITHGPLKDLYGIFQRYTDGRERVKVLLSLIGYQASAELDSACLEKA